MQTWLLPLSRTGLEHLPADVRRGCLEGHGVRAKGRMRFPTPLHMAREEHA